MLNENEIMYTNATIFVTISYDFPEKLFENLEKDRIVPLFLFSRTLGWIFYFGEMGHYYFAATKNMRHLVL